MSSTKLPPGQTNKASSGNSTGKPGHYAAALRYQPGKDEAPRVTAAGQGEIANFIRKLAHDHGVPIYEDAALAETLYRLGVDTQIPPDLYEAVAQILVFVAGMDQKIKP